jgi:hypothetical protein
MDHLAGHSGFEQHIAGLLCGWAATDPGAAAAWFQEHDQADPPPSWQAAACRELILGWAEVDLDGPARWLNARQDNPAYSESAATFARKAAAIDPTGALAWAQSIQGAWSQWAIETVGRQWLARHPGEARIALQSAGCTEEAISDMAASVPDGMDILQSSDPAEFAAIYIAD